MNDILYCIVGISGTGKDALVKRLCYETGWQQVVSYATRPRRIGEGDTHIFIPEEDLQIYKNDFAAYTKIGSFSYFTTKTQLRNPSIKFYIIDPNGVMWLKENFKERPVRVVYLKVNRELAKQRALDRGDSLETYLKRHESERDQFIQFEKTKAWDTIVHNTLSLRLAVYDTQSFIEEQERLAYEEENFH